MWNKLRLLPRKLHRSETVSAQWERRWVPFPLFVCFFLASQTTVLFHIFIFLILVLSKGQKRSTNCGGKSYIIHQHSGSDVSNDPSVTFLSILVSCRVFSVPFGADWSVLFSGSRFVVSPGVCVLSETPQTPSRICSYPSLHPQPPTL